MYKRQVTNQTSVTSTGTTGAVAGAGATVDVDSDGDGFDDGLATAGANGGFSVSIAVPQERTYTATVRARDGFGQRRTAGGLRIVTDRTAPAVTGLGLSPSTDSGVQGDLVTSFARVTVVGQTEAGLAVRVNGLAGTAGAGGAFSVSEVPLNVGLNAITVTATDAAGNVSGNQVVQVRREPLRDGELFPGYLVPVGSAPRSVTSADVDGDGDIDLVTANYYGDTVSVLLNQTNTPAARPGESARGGGDGESSPPAAEGARVGAVRPPSSFAAPARTTADARAPFAGRLITAPWYGAIATGAVERLLGETAEDRLPWSEVGVSATEAFLE